MQTGDVVRVVYKGRPTFHGVRDKFTGAGTCANPGHKVSCDGWSFDGLTPWAIEWDSRKHQLTPGRDAFIPFEAAASAFGDPRAGERITSITNERGQVGFIPDRATEVRRLRSKYDNMFGDETVVEHFPVAELYDLESGERILTVLDDPQGQTVMASKKTIAQDNDLLEIMAHQQRTINAQQEQLLRLSEQVGIHLDGTPIVNPPTSAPTESAVEDEPMDGEVFPPEDDLTSTPNSEAVTGERGGRSAGEPALDFSTLNAES